MKRKAVIALVLLATASAITSYLLFRKPKGIDVQVDPGLQVDSRGESRWSGQKYPKNRLTTGKAAVALRYSPDGRFLTVYHRDRSEVKWDVESCRIVSTSPGQDILANALVPGEGHMVGVRPNPDGTGVLRLDDPFARKKLGEMAVKDAKAEHWVSPDKQTIAAVTFERSEKGGPKSTIKLYSFPSGSVSGVIENVPGKVTKVAFSHNGRTLATVADDWHLRFWDTVAYTERGCGPLSKEVSLDYVNMQFAPNGTTLAFPVNGHAYVAKQFVVIKDIFTNKKMLPLRLIRGFSPTGCSTFSPDSSTLAVGGDDGRVRFFNVDTGRPAGEMQVGGTWFVDEKRFVDFSVSEDGKYMISRLAKGNEWLTDIDKDEVLSYGRTLMFDAHNRPLFANPGGLFDPLVHGKWENLHGRSEPGAIEKGRISKLNAADVVDNVAGDDCYAISRNAKLLAVLKRDKTCEIWDLRTGNRRVSIPSKVKIVLDVMPRNPVGVFSYDETILATQQEEDVVALWDTSTGKLLQSVPGRIANVSFNPNGKAMVVGNTCWDLDLGTKKPPFDLLLPMPLFPPPWTFSRDGTTIAALSVARAHVFNAETAQELADLTMPSHIKGISAITAIALSSDGKQIATAGGPNNEILIWDVKLKTNRGPLFGHTSVITTHERDWGVVVIAMGFTNNDRVLYSASSDGAVLFWDVSR